MTADDYIRRIEHGFRACEWGDGNPYRQQVAERLSAAGGLHRAPDVSTDRLVMDAVELLRHLPAALTKPVSPF